MPDPKEIIGEAGVKALADAGFTITPPKVTPNPVRLVTMEESRERWDRFIWTPYEGFQNSAWGRWDVVSEEWRERYNAADNWLVHTVNRRLIWALPNVGDGWVNTGTCRNADRADLLRIFCGEGQ